MTNGVILRFKVIPERVNKRLTQSPTTKRLTSTGPCRTFLLKIAYASKVARPKLQINCKPIEAIK